MMFIPNHSGISDHPEFTLTVPPVKSIIAWAKSLGTATTLPGGWKECDGSVVNDPQSPLNGVTPPDFYLVSGTFHLSSVY